MKRNTDSITIMHSIQNQVIHQFSQKDKSVSLQYHQSQVKLFHMLHEVIIEICANLIPKVYAIHIIVLVADAF